MCKLELQSELRLSVFESLSFQGSKYHRTLLFSTPLWQGVACLTHVVSSWQDRYHWDGHGGICGCLDACPIDHPAVSPSLPSLPESPPRAPELLTQGPVSLLTPEKHPGLCDSL